MGSVVSGGQGVTGMGSQTVAGSVRDGGSVGQVNGRGLSDGLDDRRSLVVPDDGSGRDDVLGDTLGKDRGHDISVAVHNGRALVGHGRRDTLDVITDLGNVGLLDHLNLRLDLGVGASGVDFLTIRRQGNSCVHAGQSRSVSIVSA